MDGLSRLARLSVRRPEVVKRNAEITALHRNQNYKECRICVAACEKGWKRFGFCLTLRELRFETAMSRLQDARGVY